MKLCKYFSEGRDPSCTVHMQIPAALELTLRLLQVLPQNCNLQVILYDSVVCPFDMKFPKTSRRLDDYCRKGCSQSRLQYIPALVLLNDNCASYSDCMYASSSCGSCDAATCADRRW